MIDKKIAIILFGLAGSGKGTQSAIMESKFDLLHIAPGDLIRAGIANGTLDEDIAKTIGKGLLIPVDRVVGIVLDEMKRHDPSSFRGVLFDGFPRNEEQDDSLRSHLSPGDFVDFAILLDVKEEDLLSRLASRLYCDNCSTMYDPSSPMSVVNGEKVCQNCGGKTFHKRDDDKDTAAVRKRFAIFESETMNVVNRYKKDGRLHVIDGSKDVHSVSGEITDIMNRYFKTDS